MVRQCNSKLSRDHPRACGENTAASGSLGGVAGSPPRVRGKQPVGEFRAARPGITPARAGKTNRGCSAAPSPADHPRACGENEIGAHYEEAARGSPPRVRGKRCQTKIKTAKKGITPARAGKTTSYSAILLIPPDHPRACGENHIPASSTVTSWGSPPRVRGKLTVACDPAGNVGITPARAGKTSGSLTATGAGGDHPRACGENRIRLVQSTLSDGSPPRVRGKRRISSLPACSMRITPARAGKTMLELGPEWLDEDHPRACGENPSSGREKCRKFGSPPRVRGKREHDLPELAFLGITPARAGKTLTI